MKGQVTCKRFVAAQVPAYKPFRKAAHFLLDHPDWILCHGYLVGAKGRKTPFAWCEKGRQVMDPRIDAMLPNTIVIGKKVLQPVRKYSYREARAQMRLHHRYARWEERWDWGFWKYTK